MVNPVYRSSDSFGGNSRYNHSSSYNRPRSNPRASVRSLHSTASTKVTGSSYRQSSTRKYQRSVSPPQRFSQGTVPRYHSPIQRRQYNSYSYPSPSRARMSAQGESFNQRDGGSSGNISGISQSISSRVQPTGYASRSVPQNLGRQPSSRAAMNRKASAMSVGNKMEHSSRVLGSGNARQSSLNVTSHSTATAQRGTSPIGRTRSQRIDGPPQQSSRSMGFQQIEQSSGTPSRPTGSTSWDSLYHASLSHSIRADEGPSAVPARRYTASKRWDQVRKNQVDRKRGNDWNYVYANVVQGTIPRGADGRQSMASRAHRKTDSFYSEEREKYSFYNTVSANSSSGASVGSRSSHSPPPVKLPDKNSDLAVTYDPMETDESKKKEEEEQLAYEEYYKHTFNEDKKYEATMKALQDQKFHLPGNTWWQDWRAYFGNNHPVFGICFHHPLHPIGTVKRLWILFGSMAFGLALTNIVYLGFVLFSEDGVDGTINLAVFNNTDENAGASVRVINSVAESVGGISKYELMLWLLGTPIHGFFDNLIWYLESASCFQTGGSMESYQWLGSFLSLFMVIGIATFASVAVLLRAVSDNDVAEFETVSDTTALISNSGREVVTSLNSKSFDFLLWWYVELSMEYFVFSFVVGTILFSGVLSCGGKLPFFAGRLGEIEELEKELEEAKEELHEHLKVRKLERVQSRFTQGAQSQMQLASA